MPKSFSAPLGVATLAWGQFYPLTQPLWQPRPRVHIASVTPGYWTLPHQATAPIQPHVKHPAHNPAAIEIPVTVSGPMPLQANPALTVRVDAATNTIVLRQALLTPGRSATTQPPITLTLKLDSTPAGPQHSQEVTP